MSDKEFMENAEGVHLMWGEYTLCGDAFDIEAVESDSAGNPVPTRKRTVTCKRCARIILECRGVRVSLK